MSFFLSFSVGMLFGSLIGAGVSRIMFDRQLAELIDALPTQEWVDEVRKATDRVVTASRDLCESNERISAKLRQL